MHSVLSLSFADSFGLKDKVMLELFELPGKGHLVDMGVDQSLVCAVEVALALLCKCLDVLELCLLHADLSVLHNKVQKLLKPGIFACFQLEQVTVCERMEEYQVLARLNLLVIKGYEVGNGQVILTVEPVYLLDSGVGGLCI